MPLIKGQAVHFNGQEHTIIEVSYLGVRVENDETGVRTFIRASEADKVLIPCVSEQGIKPVGDKRQIPEPVERNGFSFRASLGNRVCTNPPALGKRQKRLANGSYQFVDVEDVSEYAKTHNGTRLKVTQTHEQRSDAARRGHNTMRENGIVRVRVHGEWISRGGDERSSSPMKLHPMEQLRQETPIEELRERSRASAIRDSSQDRRRT